MNNVTAEEAEPWFVTVIAQDSLSDTEWKLLVPAMRAVPPSTISQLVTVNNSAKLFDKDRIDGDIIDEPYAQGAILCLPLFPQEIVYAHSVAIMECVDEVVKHGQWYKYQGHRGFSRGAHDRERHMDFWESAVKKLAANAPDTLAAFVHDKLVNRLGDDDILCDFCR